jgi:large subunit ribosomal protein L4
MPKAIKESPAKKVASVKKVSTAKPSSSSKGLKMDVFDITGKVVSSIDLPKELFEAKINNSLMAQAVRVYLANQRQGTQSTKTRGEVRGSTRKIYRQKGTGRARHGGITAPIFVGGGIALGPKPRDFSMEMPQKMRRAALSSALTQKMTANMVKIVDGLDNLKPKTKTFVEALKKLELDQENKKILVLMPSKVADLQKAMHNVKGVTFLPANQLNTYETLNAKNLIIMKSAIETLDKTFVVKGK